MKFSKSSGWYIELLSPDLNRKIEFILTSAKSGESSGSKPLQHKGEECGVIIKGKLEFYVGLEKYILNEGDSIYFNSELPHKWKVVGEEFTQTIWCITPPSF